MPKPQAAIPIQWVEARRRLQLHPTRKPTTDLAQLQSNSMGRATVMLAPSTQELAAVATK